MMSLLRPLLGSQAFATRASTVPATAALASTYPRTCGGASQTVIASGVMSLVAAYLEAGTVVTNITFVSGGTAAGTPTNQWFALYDGSRNKLAVTSDALTAAWAGSTAKTLALSSPYTVTTSGVYYLGIMVKATTVPSLVGMAVNPGLSMMAPVVAGNDATNTGLTTPATAPAVAAALTAIGAIPYAHIS
jgi:hypothetical protein